MISPVVGSTHEGPMAFSVVEGRKRMQEYFRLSGSNSGSSFGKSLTWIAFLNPIASKALFQLRVPSLTGSFQLSGKALSM